MDFAHYACRLISWRRMVGGVKFRSQPESPSRFAYDFLTEHYLLITAHCSLFTDFGCEGGGSSSKHHILDRCRARTGWCFVIL
jgi:hypothetical protein